MELSDEDLDEYVDRSSKLIDKSPQMNEQNTCRKIIEPLIGILGWEIISSEVKLEYSVQMGSGTKKADYALLLEEKPVVFVEAKGCDTDITQSHIDQLTSYMRQVGVEWGMISNGRSFEIFRRDLSSMTPNEKSLGEFLIGDIGQNKEILKAITKKSIKKGKSRQIADKIESIQNATQVLQDNKEGIAEEVTEVVTEQTGESISQNVENEAKNFVDDLISSLDAQAHPVNQETPSDKPTSDINGEYRIQLLIDGSTVEEISGNNQAESMANLADYLIEERNLLERITIPYFPGRGTGDRALINTEPEHPNGNEMRSSKQLENGYFLLTHLSSKAKIRYISELVEIVGMDYGFSENWTN
jgi:hypothetical protein